MTPPPNPGDANNTNDDDPLGGMDPMAWLESLAKRQGANADELTTAANLDIPVVPEGTHVDEPGYTPGYTSMSGDTGRTQPVKTTPPVTPQAKTPEKAVEIPKLSAVKPEPAKVEPPPPPPPAPEPATASVSSVSADDPLGGMDPMAWLESLAKRQGANVDELTTQANLDIPVVPEGTYIDEPGYTPGYVSDRPKSEKVPTKTQPVETPRPTLTAKPAEPVNPPPVQPAASKVEPPPAPPPAPEPATASVSSVSADDPLGGMDPMAWLESLAKRQGANVDELTTQANLDIPVVPEGTYIDEPGYTPGYVSDVPKQKKAPEKAPEVKPVVPPASTEPPVAASVTPAAPVEAPKQPELPAIRPTTVASTPAAPPPPVTPEPVSASVSADDPLGGMDPMAWLESMASPQENTPVETPASVTPATPSTPQPEPQLEPQPAALENDPLGGLDPLAWLESISGDHDTLLSSVQPDEHADDIFASAFPEAATTTPEPTMTADEAAKLLGITEPTAGADLAEMDPMKWLESLSLGQEIEPIDFTGQTQSANVVSPTMFSPTGEAATESMAPESAYSWLEELTREPATSPTSQPQPAVEGEQPQKEPTSTGEPIPAISEAGGLSNDISEVQRWLDDQAKSLELTRIKLETEDDGTNLAPAEPAELPDWLKNSISETPLAASVLSEQIAPPPTPADLPPWITESIGEAPSDFAAEFFGLSPKAEPTPAEPSPVLSQDDLEALTHPATGAEVDPWAEALDEEFERRQAGDESVPDWYLEALSRAEATGPMPAVSVPVQTTPEPKQPEPAPVVSSADFELPDWLTQVDEPQVSDLATGDIPDWLLAVSPETITPPSAPALPTPVASTESGATDFDDWLAGANVTPAEIPDWLKPTGMLPPLETVTSQPEPAAVEEPEQPEPAPQPEPVALPVVPAPVAATAPIQAPVAEPDDLPVPEREYAPTRVVPVTPITPVTPTIVPPVAAPISAPAAFTPPPPPPPQVVPVQPVQAAASIATPPSVSAPTPTIDHRERLNVARQLVSSAKVNDSLVHYQHLVDNGQYLEETRSDLRQLTEQNPTDPQLHRLLGDTHMRLGDLQSALDTYRKALNQL